MLQGTLGPKAPENPRENVCGLGHVDTFAGASSARAVFPNSVNVSFIP